MDSEDLQELKASNEVKIPKPRRITSEGKGNFDLSKLVDRVRGSIKDEKLKAAIGTGASLKSSTNPEDFLVMPNWFQEGTNILGIPKGKPIVIAGDTDTGKTTFCIEAIKQALNAGWGVLYAESEYKTGEEDLKAAGIDPSQVMLCQHKVAEPYFDLMFKMWDAFKEAYPDTPLIVISDSIGNLLTGRDADIDLENDSQPGGKGKLVRRAINKMVAKANEDEVAMIIVTYFYKEIGPFAPKEPTIAGGKALPLASALTYTTHNLGKLTNTRNGKDYKTGAKFKWKLRKNHIKRSGGGVPSELLWQIKDGGVVSLVEDPKKAKKEKKVGGKKKVGG